MNDALGHDRGTAAHQTEYDTRIVSPSLALVRAIASVEGVEPTTMDVLHDVVDSDALDALMRSGVHGRGGDIHVGLTFNGYRVTVHSYGVIRICPLDEGGDPAET